MKYPLLFLFLLFPLTLLTGSVNLSISDLTEALLRSEEANETALYILSLIHISEPTRPY